MTEQKELIYRLRRKDTGEWWSAYGNELRWGDKPKSYSLERSARAAATQIRRHGVRDVVLEIVVFEVRVSYAFDIEEKA